MTFDGIFNMILSLSKVNLVSYVIRQLDVIFSDGNSADKDVIRRCVNKAIDRLEFCFINIQSHYYRKNGDVFFNHLHSDHYAAFLYILSNEVWVDCYDEDVPAKIFLLNKMLNGLDVLYSIKLPDVFLFLHPVGTVLGRADYGDYFVVYQGCTVGADHDKHPKLGDGLIMYSNSSVIGKCDIGANVVLGANTVVINCLIEDNAVVVGQYPHNHTHDNTGNMLQRYFNV